MCGRTMGGSAARGERKVGWFGAARGVSGAELQTASPALALVCVPLAITCSARADVSTCHVGRRVTSE